MNIKAFAEQSGLSPHTLRYYEKIGLLKDVKRGSNGHRFYNAKDLEWVRFIVRLKDTGMPLEQIKEYADLRETGNSTMSARRALLVDHHQNLKRLIDRQKNHLHALEQKICFYDEKISS